MFDQIIINFLLAYLIALMLLGVLVITLDLDRRLKVGRIRPYKQAPIRILIGLPAVVAIPTIPAKLWHADAALYSGIGVATFVVSLVGLCAGVVFYLIRTGRFTDH